LKIAKVEYLRLSYPYTPEETWSWPGGTYHGWTTGLVLVWDDEGRYGVGEIGDGMTAPGVVPAMVEQLTPQLIGSDPRNIRGVKERLYLANPGWGRRGLGISVIGGIELALFDLVGKALGVPVHVLLGGATRTRLPVYASGGVDSTVEELARELRAHVDRGFQAVKVRIGRGDEEDLKVASAARGAVGDDVRLILDYGASYLPRPNVVEVSRLARRLEAYDPFWLEEPLHPDDLAGHRRLRQATSIPIAAGENTRTIHEVRQFLDAEAVDIIQTDAIYAGGLLEQLEIGMMAARAGVAFAPHSWGGAAGLLAAIHICACLPGALVVEYSQARNPLRERMLVEPLRMEDGELVVPEAPGLGIELAPEVIEAFPYDPAAGATLHLELKE
jgi:L-alanine-DL-glutamate epimerase-like enolase superfamily enzyme